MKPMMLARDDRTSKENRLGNKTVADFVEAFIGVYVHCGGYDMANEFLVRTNMMTRDEIDAAGVEFAGGLNEPLGADALKLQSELTHTIKN